MTFTYESPFGPLSIEIAHSGVTRIGFGRGGADPPDARVSAQLDEFFAGSRTEFDLALEPAVGTPFERAVWDAVSAIPYGATATYASIAARIGRPSACRAVGRANGRNPIALVIPCHRVVGSDGSLTGYAGGLEMKRALLAMESRRSAAGTRTH